MSLPGTALVTKEFASLTGSGTYTFKNGTMRGIAIENSSGVSLTIVINLDNGNLLGPMSINCLTPSIYEDEYDCFKSVSYVSSGAFVLYGRD